MRKLIFLFSVLCMTVMLTACGGSTGGGSTDGGNSQADPVKTDSETKESPDLTDGSAEEKAVTENGAGTAETAVKAESDNETGTAKPHGTAESDTAESDDETGSAGASEAADTENGETAGEKAETGESAAKAVLLYMGHASIRITTPEGKVIYIDPFAGEGYEPAADLILVTHGHYDHNDLDKVVNKNPDCRTITWNEALSDGTHQSFDLGFAAVEAVEAGNNQYHSIDECVGYIVTLSDGTSVYVSGDTSATEQMSSLAEKEIDYAFFCCDGLYNMDLEEAAQCAGLVGAKHNIPYHMIPADGGKFFDRSRAEQFDAPDRLILEDGQEIELE